MAHLQVLPHRLKETARDEQKIDSFSIRRHYINIDNDVLNLAYIGINGGMDMLKVASRRL